MKQAVFWMGLVLLLSSSRQEESRTDPIIKFDEPKSAIGTKEDPQARAEFELRKIRNPKTGTVPPNIRQKEIAFSQNLPSRNQLPALRTNGTQAEAWELAGPFNIGGRTRAAALDILDENTIIAGGVSGGIWKSTNQGGSWTRTSDPENRNSITALAQDTRTGFENIWYCGTGELRGGSARGGRAPYRGDGLFKSVDNGESWTQLASTQDSAPSVFGSQFQYIWRVVTNHQRLDADELLIAAYGGILRSQDGGNTWIVELGEELNNLPPDTDLNESIAPFFTEIEKNTEGHFYASMSHATSAEDVQYSGAGFYWSANGDDWHNISPPGFGTLNLSRTVIAAQGNEAYFFSNSNDLTSLFKYEFTGTNAMGAPIGNWSDLSNNLPEFEGIGELDTQSGYNMALQIDPGNPNLIFMGATNLYRSTDGFESGDNIGWIGGYEDSETVTIYENHHPDQHDVLFIPSESSSLLSINDGGLFRSNNSLANEVSWSSLNNGYVTSQFYTVNIPKTETSNLIIGGLQDNGSLISNTSANQNAFWTRVIGGDGGYTATTPEGIFWYASFQNSQIFRLSLNDNLRLQSFTRVDPTDGATRTDSDYLFINPYVLDPVNPNIMYLIGGNAIWRNNNLAQIPSGSQETTSVNWDLINSTILSQQIITTLEITHDAEFLYYGTNNSALYRLENPDQNGEERRERLQPLNIPAGAYVSSIGASPENSSEFLTIFSNYEIPSIFHSEDAGETFVDVSGNLEEFVDGTGNGPSVRWAEIVPLEVGTRYFVGTSIGLYSTDLLNGASTIWMKEGEDIIGRALVVMMDYRPLDGALVAASHGNGMFRTSVSGFKKINATTSGSEKFRISNVFPNPFEDVARIEIDLPETSFMTVDIFDMLGNHVRNLMTGQQFGGKNTVSWDGRNQSGVPMRDGMYVYRIVYNDKIEGGRIVYNR